MPDRLEGIQVQRWRLYKDRRPRFDARTEHDVAVGSPQPKPDNEFPKEPRLSGIVM